MQDGGQAFPVQKYPGDWHAGMSLRDYFAGQALLGIVSYGGGSLPDYRVQLAYEIADKMIKERAKNG